MPPRIPGARYWPPRDPHKIVDLAERTLREAFKWPEPLNAALVENVPCPLCPLYRFRAQLAVDLVQHLQTEHRLPAKHCGRIAVLAALCRLVRCEP